MSEHNDIKAVINKVDGFLDNKQNLELESKYFVVKYLEKKYLDELMNDIDGDEEDYSDFDDEEETFDESIEELPVQDEDDDQLLAEENIAPTEKQIKASEEESLVKELSEEQYGIVDEPPKKEKAEEDVPDNELDADIDQLLAEEKEVAKKDDKKK